MDSEDSTNPAHKHKYIDPGNEAPCSAPKSPLLSSPPFERLEEHQDGKDSQPFASPAPDAPTIDPTQSASERARERYLKGDPLALVLSPSFVECRQCKRKIKLSSKSAYDPFHWRNHRTRCIKAHKRTVKTMNKASTPKKSLTPPLSARLPSLDRDKLMHTPLLLSDSDDDHVSDCFEENASSPTPSSYFTPPKQESPSSTYSSLDTMFDDYLRRSHPDYAQPVASVRSTGRWQNWSWSQLKPPRFPIPDDDNYDDDTDDDPPDPFEIPSNIFRRAAASSPLFVS